MNSDTRRFKVFEHRNRFVVAFDHGQQSDGSRVVSFFSDHRYDTVDEARAAAVLLEVEQPLIEDGAGMVQFEAHKTQVVVLALLDGSDA